MAANSRGGGKSSSKSEDVEILLKRIDEQNELIGRLQSKFRDVTHAYRSLKAENQALEITIKSLKTKNNSVSTSNSSTTLATTKPAASPSQTEIQEASAEQARTETSGNDDQLKKIEQDASSEEKIAALTANIQVVLENKARLEANYQAEKKKLRAEIEELKSKLEVFKQESLKTNESYESKLKELKNNLKQSQSDRENLTVELNNMLKVKQSEQDNKVLSIQEENQSVMMGLRAENNDLKIRIKNLNKQFDNKCEELVQFDNEFKNLKLLHEEQLKTDEAELASLRSQLREQTQTNETRVRDLESRIAQLCSVVANYETTGVMELKDHEASNDDARQQTNSPRFISPQKSKTLEKEMGELNLKSSDKMDFDSAVEQISHLKSYIESTARELNINFNFNEIWLQSGEFNSKLEKEKQKELENENTKLKEENRHLKEEYEKFKIRTNYLIKSAKHLNKENQEGGSQSSSEIQQQQQQISKLKDEIETLKKRLIVLRQEKEDELNRESDRHEREESHLRLEMRQQYEKLENERLKCVGDLELELKKQRERTLKLLAEKEAEIEQLIQQHRMKAFVKSRVVNDDSSPESNTSSLGDPSTNSGDGQTTLNGTLPTLIVNSPEATAAELGANYMLYYNQQLAYKDSELNKLRVAKSDLEYKLKQLVDEHSVDIERMQAQIGLLKDEIERCKLNDARVDLNRENLEYIKNVVFNYMTARDANVRASMINAIIQILKFSKSEKMKLNQMMNGAGGAGAGAVVGSLSPTTGKLP